MMGKLNIILLEAGLELVPAEISREPSVVKNARKRGKKPVEILLDISVHYHAARKLKDWMKRGRPDIVHTTLLQLLDGPAARNGLVNVFVHTYGNKLISFKTGVRIPRNYNRFTGLMEQLLVEGRVPPGSREPLIRVEDYGLEDFPQKTGLKGLILLWEKGEPAELGSLVTRAIEEGYAIGIGAFQHGDFSESVLEIATEKYSIYKESLPTWIVASRLITAFELKQGLLRI
jgi:rRNA small subunit pseudouridine methyltransferase Nep1